MTDWSKLTQACQQAMKLAAEKPGRYGGRYVGRLDAKKVNGKWIDGDFIVLDDDDPDAVPKHVDVLAQVTPTKVYAIGGARNYLREDGTVSFHD